MRKFSRRFIAAAAASLGLLAATPAYAGYDLIHLDAQGNVVGYQLFCGGTVVQEYGILTGYIIWFYNSSC